MNKLRKSPRALLPVLILVGVTGCNETALDPITASERGARLNPGMEAADGRDGVFVGAGYDVTEPDITVEERGVFVGAGYDVTEQPDTTTVGRGVFVGAGY